MIDTHGLDIQAGAKALVPNEFRPVSDKESWGEPLLTGSQFLALVGFTFTSFFCGLLLYYSFYVAFILSSVEAFSPSTEKPPRPRVAGSYRRLMRHVLSSYGWRYFVGGVVTFSWTTAITFAGGFILQNLALPPIHELLGGPAMISGLFLEPLSIVFTHKVLSPVGFSSFGTLSRLLRSSDLYIALVYIATVRMVCNALQSSLMVTDNTQHYSRPFATFTAYLTVMIIKIVLVTRAHASLLPPTVTTTVDITPPTQYEPSLRLWQGFLRTIKMFKLLFVCTILATVHTVATLASILYASGQSQKIINWAYSTWNTPQGRPTRDPGLMMAHDPEMDPHHFH